MSVESYGALLRLDERPLATRDGEFRLHRFRNLATGRVALVAVIGDVGTAEPLRPPSRCSPACTPRA